MKSVGIWSYSGPHFSAFGMNTERYSVSLRIQSECAKMRTRITPNTDTFYAVNPTTLSINSMTIEPKDSVELLGVPIDDD